MKTSRRNLLAVLAAGLGLATIAWAWIEATGGREPAREPIVIRFAHHALFDGVRAAYDEAAREYERLHPGVRVEQIAVPDRYWGLWCRTRFAGGDAPDLLMSTHVEDPSDWRRHFLPLRAWMERPNPYNAGTPLTGVAWEQTFLDGLSNPKFRPPHAGEVFAVPTFADTIRLAVNPGLLRELTGSDQPPATFEEFLAACARIRQVATSTGRRVAPIAASRDRAQALFQHLFRRRTRELARQAPALAVGTREFALELVRGRLAWNDPILATGYGTLQEVAANFPAGFMGLDRAAPMFQFAQQQAVFATVGSRDMDEILRACRFPVQLIRFPFPEEEPSRIEMLAMLATGEPLDEFGLDSAYSVNAASPHRAQAVDFLQFLTSYETSRRFSARASRLSPLIGVEAPGCLQAFSPRSLRALTGVDWRMTAFGGNLSLREIDTNLFRLFGGATPERFMAALEQRLPAALVRDLAVDERRTLRAAASADAAMVAQLVDAGASAETVRRSASQLALATNLSEAQALQNRWVRLRHPARPTP